MTVINAWTRSVVVDIPLEKSVMMLLKGRLSSSRPPVIRVDGIILRYEAKMK